MDKERVYENWSKALIAKIFGRSLGYQILLQKLHAIWKSTKQPSLIDLGYDYYMVKFTKEANYNKVYMKAMVHRESILKLLKEGSPNM